MKVLITAGSTNVMIDKVRCISNIFKGRTGSELARYFSYNGYDREADSFDMSNKHEVTLITSNPHHHLVENIKGLNILPYKTYDELYSLMEQQITSNDYDVVIHSAAVSDYKVAGTYASKGGVHHEDLHEVDSSTKISSSAKELYIKLVPTEKIIDKIRDLWGFKGKLVKFKLQVGMTDEELLDIAFKSMQHSNADFIVANCLEWARDRAFIISGMRKMGSHGKTIKRIVKEVARNDLSSELVRLLA